MPKIVSPIIRSTFNPVFGAAVGVALGPGAADGVAVLEAVRFNTRLSRFSQVSVHRIVATYEKDYRSSIHVRYVALQHYNYCIC